MDVIGLDVGGTAIKSGLINAKRGLVFEHTTPTERSAGAHRVVDNISRAAAAVLDESARHGADPAGIGLAVPGWVDESRGVAVSSSNIDWHDVPLKSMMEERFSLPCTVVHDVRAGALAEMSRGAGRSHSNAVFVAIGTGIGGAIIVDGHCLTGDRYSAGELGHVVVRPGGRLCACGQRGCLETIASGRGLTERYESASGHHVDGAAEVVAAARAGDPDAREVWRDAVDVLAALIMTTSKITGIELYILGGGVALAGDDLLGPLVSSLERRRNGRVAPRVVLGALGRAAGCLGAALSVIGMVHARRMDAENE